MSASRFSWASRGLNSQRERATAQARRAELRARILRVLAVAGDAGIVPGEACDTLATKATRSEVCAEAGRMRADGLLRHEGAGSAHRWYLTAAGRDAAGKAAA